MSYGIEVWDSSGTQILGVNETISRLRYATVAISGQNGSVTLSDIVGKDIGVIAYTLSDDVLKWGHYAYRSSSDTISWEARSGGNGSSDSQILVFVYT